MKLRYDDDTEWDADEDEPEEEALFFEMRKVSILYLETVKKENANIDGK